MRNVSKFKLKLKLWCFKILPIFVLSLLFLFIIYRLQLVFIPREFNLNFQTWKHYAIFFVPGFLIFCLLKLALYIIKRNSQGKLTIMQKITFYSFFHFHKMLLPYECYWKVIFFFSNFYEAKLTKSAYSWKHVKVI